MKMPREGSCIIPFYDLFSYTFVNPSVENLVKNTLILWMMISMISMVISPCSCQKVTLYHGVINCSI
jgi:hypothetical protein